MRNRSRLTAVLITAGAFIASLASLLVLASVIGAVGQIELLLVLAIAVVIGIFIFRKLTALN